MNKSKSEKLLDSIGDVNDRWVNELMEEPKIKASSSAKPIAKRLVVAAAAALLCVSLFVTAVARVDELSAMFVRRKDLIDDKVALINESATVGNITMTVDSVKVYEAMSDSSWLGSGAFIGSYTISFHNEGGIFDAGLKYSGYKLEFLHDSYIYERFNGGDWVGSGEWVVIKKFDSEKPEENYPYSYNHKDYGDGYSSFLHEINFGLDDPSDTITIVLDWLSGKYAKCRITFYKLTSYDESIKYADELSVEFEVSEETAKPIELLRDYKPETEFEIEGATFTVSSIDMYPDYVLIFVNNEKAETVNIAGVECYAINYFSKLAHSNEFFEKAKEISKLDFPKGVPDTDEIGKWWDWGWLESEERQEMFEDVSALCKRTEDKDILNECYELAIEIKAESGAEVSEIINIIDYNMPRVEINPETGGISVYCVRSMNNCIDAPEKEHVGCTFKFSSPIYVDDIVRIYARKIGDPSKEVNVWVPAEDKGLDAFRQ